MEIFTPAYYSHLVDCAIALTPHPVPKVKRVVYVYILELLNGEESLAFFDLKEGGRKANNIQDEKNWSCASECEREPEAAKAAKTTHT